MFKNKIIRGEPVRYCPRCRRKALMCKCHIIPPKISVRKEEK